MGPTTEKKEQLKATIGVYVNITPSMSQKLQFFRVMSEIKIPDQHMTEEVQSMFKFIQNIRTFLHNLIVRIDDRKYKLLNRPITNSYALDSAKSKENLEHFDEVLKIMTENQEVVRQSTINILGSLIETQETLLSAYMPIDDKNKVYKIDLNIIVNKLIAGDRKMKQIIIIFYYGIINGNEGLEEYENGCDACVQYLKGASSVLPKKIKEYGVERKFSEYQNAQ